MHGSMNVTKE